MSVIKSDYVWIAGQQYPLANGSILRHRIFTDGQFQVQRDRNQPDYSDLNPYTNAYEMTDFSRGIGHYVDHKPKFDGKVWASTLDHAVPGVVRLPAAVNAITGITDTIYKLIMFQGTCYALTDVGLYTVNLSTLAAAAVAATPVAPFYDGCIHKGTLWLAGGATTTVRHYDPSGGWIVPANTINADRLCELDGRIFGAKVYSAANGGVQVYHTADIGATAWVSTIFYPDGSTAAAITSPMGTGAQAFISAPTGPDTWMLYLSTNSAVWEIDYTVGSYRVLIETPTGSLYNGRALVYWGSTGLLYTNQKNNMIAINLETKASVALGPEMTGAESGITDGFPSTSVGTGSPSGLKFTSSGISAAAVDGNYLYIGTKSAVSFSATVAKLDPQHTWSYEGALCGIDPQVGASSWIDEVRSILSVEATGDIPSTSDAVIPRLLAAGVPNISGSGYPAWMEYKRGDLFSSQSSAVYFLETPWITCGLPNTQKTAYTLTLDCSLVPTNHTLQVRYRTDYDNNPVNNTLFAPAITSASTLPLTYPFASSAGQAFRSIKFIFSLYSTTAGPVATSAEFVSAVLSWRPAVPVKYAWDVELLIDPDLERLGVYTNLESLLDTALTGATTIAFIPSDNANGTTYYVAPVGPDIGAVDAEAALLDSQQGVSVLPRIKLRLAQVI